MIETSLVSGELNRRAIEIDHSVFGTLSQVTSKLRFQVFHCVQNRVMLGL